MKTILHDGVVGSQYPTGHDFMANVTLWWACPWTLSTAVVLGGALCMIVIGALHTSLGKTTGDASAGAATTAALWVCLLSLVGILLTGYIGYLVVDAIWLMFYYSPVAAGKNVWLLMQLACIAVLAIGVGMAFLDIRRAGYPLEVGVSA